MAINSSTIKRRKLGQLFVGSAVTAFVSSLAGKSFAKQKSQQMIYGIQIEPSKPKTLSFMGSNRGGPSFSLSSLDLSTGKVGSKINLTSVSSKEVLKELKTQERVTSLIHQNNESLIFSTVTQTDGETLNQLYFINDLTSQSKVSVLQLSGLMPTHTIESILVTKDDQLLAITSLNKGTLPFVLAKIDRVSGKVMLQNKPRPGSAFKDIGLPDLLATQRYGNLVQSPKGKILATVTGKESNSPVLAEVNLVSKQITLLSRLTFESKPLGSDVLDLTYSTSGQLLALADLEGQGTTSLFAVNEQTGKMEFLKDAAVSKVVLV